jgi:sugar lactone lactonase YvrE
MIRVLTMAAALTAGGVLAAVAAPASEKKPKAFPETISLGQGFQPEGIEVGKGTTFYVGSVASGALFKGNLRTGTGSVLVQGGAGRSLTGIELDNRNRLFVAGAAGGKAYVFNANTGAEVHPAYTLASAPTFINDVVVTRTAAYFTDSMKAVLYRIPIGAGGALGDAQTIPLTGDFSLQPGFNLNGIDATANGKTLIAVQSNTGKLFRIDPATGVTRLISLGTESVPNGDGILLDGKTLYVVQNQQNRVAVIALTSNLASGRVVTRLSDPDFAVPTTIDDLGKRLYAVNARFGAPSPATTDYQVVQLRKPKGR